VSNLYKQVRGSALDILVYQMRHRIATPNASPTLNSDQCISLPSLPPNPPHPPYPSLHILSTLQQLHTIPTPSQLLIPCNPMHKRMTSPTQPRHSIQFLLTMPPSFQNPLMRNLGYQMMIRQGYPLAMTQFAFRRARQAPYGWRRGGGCYVRGENGCEVVE
jgi:hypothetical protein